jgi:hypothetical protein
MVIVERAPASGNLKGRRSFAFPGRSVGRQTASGLDFPHGLGPELETAPGLISGAALEAPDQGLGAEGRSGVPIK